MLPHRIRQSHIARSTRSRAHRLRRRLRLESLERRALLTTFVVDSIGDDNTDIADGALTLREAIMAANMNAEFGDAPAGSVTGDRIEFNLPSGSTIQLDFGELEISDDLSIDAKRAGIVIDAGGDSRILNISTNETVGIKGLTLTGGVAENGGAILNAGGGTLKIYRSVISGNVANGDMGSGGGILNDENGVLQVFHSQITGNTANGFGGGIEDASDVSGVVGVLMVNVKLDNNHAGFGPNAFATPGDGGGLHVTGVGNVKVVGGTARDNVAAREGGGLWNGTGRMTIVGTEISGNTALGALADDGGGGIFNNGGDLMVYRAKVVGNVADGVFGSGGGIFSTAGNVKVVRSTIRDNVANRAGGGIEVIDGELKIVSSSLKGNIAGPDGSANPGNGGALHVTGRATNVLVRSSRIHDNSAATEGGGLWNQAGSNMTIQRSSLTGNTASGNLADEGGGGVFNNGGQLFVDRSLIANNAADGSGGGIFNATSGEVKVTRSAIGRNSAGSVGGGVFNAATLDLAFSQLYRNRAVDAGGGIFTDDDGTTELKRTRVSRNSPDNLAGPGAAT